MNNNKVIISNSLGKIMLRQISFVYLKPLIAVALATCWLSSQAQESEKLHQRANAAMCANCHGSEGRTVEQSAVPSLAGLPREYFIQQMQAYKDGSRKATVMHQLSKGFSDAQIASMADYFSALPR
jgi:cytochrome subunit of sulfide dehydrogenase